MAQPGARLEHQAGHFAGVGAGGHGNVLEPAAQMALRIGHRSAEQRREADAGWGALIDARIGSRFRPRAHGLSVDP